MRRAGKGKDEFNVSVPGRRWRAEGKQSIGQDERGV